MEPVAHMPHAGSCRMTARVDAILDICLVTALSSGAAIASKHMRAAIRSHVKERWKYHYRSFYRRSYAAVALDIRDAHHPIGTPRFAGRGLWPDEPRNKRRHDRIHTPLSCAIEGRIHLLQNHVQGIVSECFQGLFSRLFPSIFRAGTSRSYDALFWEDHCKSADGKL